MHQFIQTIQTQLQLYNVLSCVIKAVNQEADTINSTYKSKTLSRECKKFAIVSGLIRLGSIIEAYQPHIADFNIRPIRVLNKKNIRICTDALMNYQAKLHAHLAKLSSHVQNLLSESPIHQMLLSEILGVRCTIDHYQALCAINMDFKRKQISDRVAQIQELFDIHAFARGVGNQMVFESRMSQVDHSAYAGMTDLPEQKTDALQLVAFLLQEHTAVSDAIAEGAIIAGADFEKIKRFLNEGQYDFGLFRSPVIFGLQGMILGAARVGNLGLIDRIKQLDPETYDINKLAKSAAIGMQYELCQKLMLEGAHPMPLIEGAQIIGDMAHKAALEAKFELTGDYVSKFGVEKQHALPLYDFISPREDFGPLPLYRSDSEVSERDTDCSPVLFK